MPAMTPSTDLSPHNITQLPDPYRNVNNSTCRRAPSRRGFSPPLTEVEVGGVLRLEHHLPTWVRQHEEQHVGGAMAAEVVGDGVHPLDLLRQPTLDLLEEGHPVGRAPARVGPGEGSASGRTEGAEDIALAAPTVVDLLPGAA